MFRLLKWEVQFVLAVLGLAFRGGAWLARLPFRKRAQPAPAPQRLEQPVAATPLPAPIAPPANPPAPPIHVTINLPPEAVARPAAPQPEPSGPPSAAAILARPDHRIYVTTGSHLMIPHPREAGLLEWLDRMLYVAAHRDGAPFTLPPTLDDSQPTPARAEAFTPPPVDDGFDPVTPHSLPPPDGALWIVRLGHKPERVPGKSA